MYLDVCAVVLNSLHTPCRTCKMLFIMYANYLFNPDSDILC